MDTAAPGFYQDPDDRFIHRYWDGQQWTMETRTSPTDKPMGRSAAHVGKSTPPPGEGLASGGATNEPAATRQQAPATSASSGGLGLAIVWLIISAIVGATFILGADSGEYGGDAYTDIQNASAQTVRALGVLIIGTGVLGLITALSRRR